MLASDVTKENRRPHAATAVGLHPAVLGGEESVQLLGEILHHVVAFRFAVHQHIEAEMLLQLDHIGDLSLHPAGVLGLVDLAGDQRRAGLTDLDGLRKRPDRRGRQRRQMQPCVLLLATLLALLLVYLAPAAAQAAGTIPVGRISQPFEDVFGGREELSPFRSLFYQPSENEQYVLAAHIQGKPQGVQGAAGPLNVVLVADVEMVSDIFFRWREQGSIPGQEINFDFDNVTFVLNALDSLAGDDRFLELRKRRPQHRTLELFDARTLEARNESAQARKLKSAEHDETIKKAIEEVQAKLKEIAQQAKRQKLDPTAIAQRIANETRNLNRRLDEQKSENHQKYNEEIRKINDQQESKILAMQGTYKLWAVVIPPIPPLLVAAGVFFYRRSKEREGVSSKRLR